MIAPMAEIVSIKSLLIVSMFPTPKNTKKGIKPFTVIATLSLFADDVENHLIAFFIIFLNYTNKRPTS